MGSSGYHEGMEKGKYGFGFRCERLLWYRIMQHCAEQSQSVNRFVQEAVCFAGRLHDRRHFFIKRTSGFIGRNVLADRINTLLILKSWTRIIVRNFAIVYQRSMAEVIRMMLELYLDWRDKENGKIRQIRHYYSKPQMCIQCSIIGLYPIFPPELPPGNRRSPFS